MARGLALAETVPHGGAVATGKKSTWPEMAAAYAVLILLWPFWLAVLAYRMARRR